MGYTLITANRNYSSWSLRPWLLMQALGLPFVDRVEAFVDTLSYDTFRRFSPTGQVPVLLDGNRTVWDSLAITLYLAERHAGIWPADEGARAWTQSAVAEMHGGFGALRSVCTMNVGVRVRPNPFSAVVTREIARVGELWTEGLSRFGGPFLAGRDFSAADAFYAPVVFRVRTYGLEVGSAGGAWVRRMLDHPAMRAWETAALAETWRDPAHEAELATCGTVLEDHRAR
jgi:glutathione S-transferase